MRLSLVRLLDKMAQNWKGSGSIKKILGLAGEKRLGWEKVTSVIAWMS